jgi:carboxyl-terminal processing protease
MKKNVFWIVLTLILSSCGGGGSSSGSGSNSSGASYASLAAQCAAPRPAGTVDPVSHQAYNDTQGTLTTEMAWIASYVSSTYLWYADVPVVSSAPYQINATVNYVNPSNNRQSTKVLANNYDVVDAYFNSQRSPLTTASGKPKDQFHFTYPTSVWDSLSASGIETGFGFQVALIAASPPRVNYVAYTSPGTTAAQNNVQRGAQFISVNGVDVANGSDLATLNEGLFAPIAGKQYTFVVLDQGSTVPRTITMTASNVSLTPVMNVGTLPAPNAAVGYMLFNDHLATAESELIAAVNKLNAANNGTGIRDLVLDIRYNGGGYLAIASELAYMIAGAPATAGKTFEQETFNNKNPFPSDTAATPFYSQTVGLSAAAGQALPQLGLSTVYVITTGSTCSASEAVINGLRGIGVRVVQIGSTTCGKPYGFLPQDNCSTTYFTIQFEGVNNAGFGAYADGFIPGGSGSAANNLPGCVVADDFTKQLGDPSEANLAAALQFRANGTCPAAPTASSKWMARFMQGESALKRSPARENRILRRIPQASAI